MRSVSGSSGELTCQARDVGGTLSHAGGDVGNLVAGDAMKTGGEDLRETADDVKRCSDFVVHVLDKGGLPAVRVEFQLIGTGQFVVLLLKLVVDVTDGRDRVGQ